MVESALFALLLVVTVGVTRILLAARHDRRGRDLLGAKPLFFTRHVPPEIARRGGETWPAHEKY